ncbi:hypothetical protein A2Y99_03735 [Candidatus Gottesmanbacteria bacterium RBG_13_37_7]|uniref:Glycosyltransferase 2-like domain-containing protein n=1 Tax=Candidatus Gottesmanbacteria bacterium RBG_13_37_7 TaxID=1798369 RepID=A0A1F5YK25_9BACT|nr:MAG: hypothetical protein A2Y99_03735 [Candidatus Gottesmanbacteria bacterium RBG_13_37_7]
MKIVHIIPTYNEKENIGKMITELINIGKKFSAWKSEILIVDDNSPDGTGKVVLNYKIKYPHIHLITRKKEGLGKALIDGYEFAINKLHADIVVPNDADFQWNPKDFPKLVKKIEEGYDVAVGSRHIPGGKVIGWNWFRKLNHEISNSILAWWVAGVHEVIDHAGNFKAIRVKNILDKVQLRKINNAGFSFQLHILYELSKTGAKFIEVPMVFKERRFGKSKIGFNRYYIRDVIEYIKSSIQIRIERSSSFFKYAIVGIIGFLIQTLISKIMINRQVNPGVSVSIGAEGAIISNFILNNFWTFSSKSLKRQKIISKFIQFNIVSIGAIIIQGLIVSIGTSIFGRETWFIFMFGAIIFIVIPYSYFMYNKFIWKKNSKGGCDAIIREISKSK